MAKAIKKQNSDFTFDAIVVGIGHAGIEASLSLARMGHKTIALSVTLDNAGYLACNPSIGGTAKGHLVCEVDALGGQMGVTADATLTHLRMLNLSKGPAVHSLRAQVDKYKYHDYMKNLLENEPNLHLRQGEVKELLVKNGEVTGVRTVTGLTYSAKVVVLACGVYLNSSIIIGDTIEDRGPVGFPRANYLAQNLSELGFEIRRFKTGTPARVKRSSVDLSQLEIQDGEDTPYSFSSMTSSIDNHTSRCYLGYTNLDTHKIISDNLSKSPKYAGLIRGAGARYCPSVEDKIVRFSDKERHQFFLEPEGEKTQEMYVQGLSTGLPSDIQLELYKSIKGFENIEIMRDAYAIEYDCINPTQLFTTLGAKAYKGLYFAGQINGTSGYEEAGAQGLLAGINASCYIKKKEPVILPRDKSYIGVLIDDLVTVGTNEPYRMMTSRAEYRLLLRQDNADLRLTELGKKVGLVGKEKYSKYLTKVSEIEKIKTIISKTLPMAQVDAYFEKIGESKAKGGITIKEIIKRNAVTKDNFCESFDIFNEYDKASVYDTFIELKYEGYLERERRMANESRRVENMSIDPSIDFLNFEGLRNEAREKLNSIRPLTIGQASRISGVTPADINVLIIKLTKK